MQSAVARFRRDVETALGGRSAISAAVSADLPRDAIRSVLEGHEPKLSRVLQICRALGLDLYIGPPRNNDVSIALATTAYPVEPAEIIEGKPVAGCMWFTKSWLGRRGLDPVRLEMFRVQDDSMEPMLHPDGGGVADNRQTEREEGLLYLVRFADGSVAARRAARGDDGAWLLRCDNPDWPDKVWPNDAKTIGRIVWAARSTF